LVIVVTVEFGSLCLEMSTYKLHALAWMKCHPVTVVGALSTYSMRIAVNAIVGAIPGGDPIQHGRRAEYAYREAVRADKNYTTCFIDAVLVVFVTSEPVNATRAAGRSDEAKTKGGGQVASWFLAAMRSPLERVHERRLPMLLRWLVHNWAVVQPHLAIAAQGAA
jgi:hypothetical protein